MRLQPGDRRLNPPKRGSDTEHRRLMNRAHGAVERALKRGTLIRSETCEDCGEGGRIQGHHEDYERPLEVVWVCIPCHGVRHRGRVSVAA